MKKPALILGSAVALVLCTVGSAADARSLGSAAGVPANSSQASCVAEPWFGVKNACSAVLPWDIHMPIDGPGTYSPVYNAYTPGGSVITCNSFAVDYYLTYTVTPDKSSTPGASYPTVSPGPVTVPAHGFLGGGCYIPPNGRLLNVEY